MYFMYVDESGDIGLEGSPTRYFILTGVIIHETSWLPALEQLITFRRRMKTIYGLKLKEEIHSSAFITNPKELSRIKKHDRLAIIRNFADEISSLLGINIINVVVDKNNKGNNYDVFEKSWQALLQRFSNTITNKNFPHPLKDKDTHFIGECGIILPDNTDNKKLQSLLRKMRHYNYVPGMNGLPARNIRLQNIVEDPYFKNSEHSYFTQVADTSAYLLQQQLNPCSFIRRKGATNYFNRLLPALCLVASRNHSGIVRL